MPFKKGETGNPNGRPAKNKLPVPKKVLKQLKDAKSIEDKVEIAMNFLMENPSTYDDMFRIIKEIAPYAKPKLSSIKSEIQQDTNINIRIEGIMDLAVDNQGKALPKDVTPQLDPAKDVTDIIDAEYSTIDPDVGV